MTGQFGGKTTAKRPGARSCHDRALGLLAVRPRSRRELETRLLRAGFDAEEVEGELERLEGVGLVDDEAFARRVIEHEVGSRGSGRRLVGSVLARSGVTPAVAAGALASLGDDEEERARDLAARRAKRMGSLEPAVAFRRLTSFLLRRGYGPEMARRAARSALEIDRGVDSEA